jgi:hypothetical protein
LSHQCDQNCQPTSHDACAISVHHFSAFADLRLSGPYQTFQNG